jgi:hypothetical protein
MGYGIQLVRGKSRAKIRARLGDIPKGGTYRMGGADEEISDQDLSFHITYNYSWYFYETIDKEKGVRAIYGMKGKDARKLLEAAIPKLNDMIEKETRTGKVLSQSWGKDKEYDPASTNYWDTNARNAKKAVEGLINLCLIAPTFTFQGD